MRLEQSSHNWTQTVTDTWWCFILKHSHLWNGIMIFMTENYWQLFELWKLGDIIFKDLDIQQSFSLIIRI